MNSNVQIENNKNDKTLNRRELHQRSVAFLTLGWP